MIRFPRTAAGLVAALALAATAAPAHAATAGYVALGDSYSSGVGTRAYLADGTSCQRSVYAYPSLLAAAKGYALNLRACSGATTGDVTSSQLSALSSATAYVTITAGGNDAGFTDVLSQCALPAWASNCNGAVDKAVTFLNATLPGRLTALYAAIRSRAGGARVVVAGYPRIFDGQDCNALTWFSPGEETRLNATADLLDAKLAAAAAAAGFRYAGPTSAFVGHAVCDSPEWLTGLSNPISESYHPNRLGHSAGYTPLVGAGLTGAAVPVSAATVRTAVGSAPGQAALQRRYAALDRGIRPEVFQLPDLHSPGVVAAAARAGVDLTSRASIDAADRAYAAAQAAAR